MRNLGKWLGIFAPLLMTFPRFRLSGPSRSRILMGLPFVLGAFLLWACISDGPDQTGLGYIQNGGVQLSTPLKHYIFKDFPLDSAFGTELPLNHFGETLLVVGRERGYRATARMGFQITVQTQRDSIAKGLNLRMVAVPAILKGFSFLRTSTQGHDSISLLIEAFAWNDTGGGKYNDSLGVFHRRILNSYTSFSTFDTTFKVKDTARIALAKAFDSVARDSIQVCALKNLQKRLSRQSDTAHQWQVFLEISPLKGGTDSGLFRFTGTGGTVYSPGLLLGTYSKGAGNTPTLLAPYTASGLPSVNYQVTHTGDNQTLLFGVSRGINLRLNRNRLLDSIQARLGSAFPASTTGKYDTRFYVPYAEIHLPLVNATNQIDPRTHVDGPFALDMQMVSESDSGLDPQSTAALIPVALGSSLKLYALPSSSTSYSTQSADTLICSYAPNPSNPLDSTLRRIVLRWVNDSTVRDTLYVTADGNRHELGLSLHSGWTRYATLGVYPEAGQAKVEVYFNSGSVESNGFVDRTTGQQKTTFKDLAARYWRPGASELTVRATHGLGALLNRKTGVTPALFLRPADRLAFDTTTASDGSSYLRVLYPVLGEVGFPRGSDGKLRVTVDVYLYPLSNP